MEEALLRLLNATRRYCPMHYTDDPEFFEARDAAIKEIARAHGRTEDDAIEYEKKLAEDLAGPTWRPA